MTVEATSVEETQSNTPTGWRYLTSPALILGGVTIVGIMLLEILATYGTSLVQPFFEGASLQLATSLLAILLLIGLVGVYRRYAAPTGIIGKAGILLSALAAAFMAVAGLGQLLFAIDIDLLVRLLALFVVLPGGMLLFGYATLRTRALPRWNALPLLIGATAILNTPAVFEVIPHFPTGTIAYLLSGVGWILLGILLWADMYAPATLGFQTTE